MRVISTKIGKKYKVKKKDVIKALETEPLTSGNFFLKRSTKDDGKCKVCAVGAVLRATKRKTFNNVDAERACDLNFSACDDYEESNFLSMLSVEFERAVIDELDLGRVEEQALEFGRMHALNLTHAFCPDVLEFGI